ncbi:MAG: SDR family NAD(P)-dependent oxidoreductase [Gammaproteobacteria bacterium]
MASKLRFNGKVAVITGASRGLGFAIAEGLAREGATTVLAARSEDQLRQAADKIRTINPKVLAVSADVSLQADVERLVAQTEAQFGRIDIVINNAGNAYGGLIEEAEFSGALRRMLEVSLFGKIYVTQVVLPVMKQQQAGHIVNISSVLGRKAFPRLGAYSMVMHAISAFSDALRQELRGTGIAVTSVYPALMRSALFESLTAEDLPPQFQALTPLTVDVVAEKILTAVHKKRARIVIPSQPKLLLLADALSPRFGDFVMRLLLHKSVTRLLGLYSGQLMQQYADVQKRTE